jgi:hypothetical protein
VEGCEQPLGTRCYPGTEWWTYAWFRECLHKIDRDGKEVWEHRFPGDCNFRKGEAPDKSRWWPLPEVVLIFGDGTNRSRSVEGHRKP